MAEEITRVGPPDVLETQDHQAVGYVMVMRRLTHTPVLAPVPLVATDVGGQRELIRSGANGILCRAGDTADLSPSLAAVLDLAPPR